MGYEPAPSLLGHCEQKPHGLRGLLCRWPSITEWDAHHCSGPPRLWNDLYCVEWDVKLYYTIPYHTISSSLKPMLSTGNTSTLMMVSHIHKSVDVELWESRQWNRALLVNLYRSVSRWQSLMNLVWSFINIQYSGQCLSLTTLHSLVPRFH